MVNGCCLCNSLLNNPRGYDIISLFNATVAQLVEHLIRNERVVGSNPISSSIDQTGPSLCWRAFFVFDIFFSFRHNYN